MNDSVDDLDVTFYRDDDKTHLNGDHGRHRQHSVAKQNTDQIVSDLAEFRVVFWSPGQRQTTTDGEKDAGEEIHCRLVGNESVDVATELSTRKDQHRENDAVSTHAREADYKSDCYRRERH